MYYTTKKCNYLPASQECVDHFEAVEDIALSSGTIFDAFNFDVRYSPRGEDDSGSDEADDDEGRGRLVMKRDCTYSQCCGDAGGPSLT